MRQRVQPARREQPPYGAQRAHDHRMLPTDLLKIEGQEGLPGLERARSERVARVGIAQINQAPGQGLEEGDAAGHRLRRQRVDDHVHAFAAGARQDFVHKIQRA